MDLHAWITQQVDETESEGRAMLGDPTPLLRRCEADRRILARHQAWPNSHWCEGCGPDLDTRLSDCPELLDLAHAHSMTDEILASLDQSQPPEPQPRDGRRLGLSDIRATPPITTSDVPAALRGPRWKP
ncbi:hypothetical protein ACFYWD_20880 [Streptomyces sp. NPDC003781]|uniref:hypothetical protein n=1 Tax=Streptomyces sp. NPDC003781 TaxID=3364686 RepID=UPI0036D196CA